MGLTEIHTQFKFYSQDSKLHEFMLGHESYLESHEFMLELVHCAENHIFVPKIRAEFHIFDVDMEPTPMSRIADI